MKYLTRLPHLPLSIRFVPTIAILASSCVFAWAADIDSRAQSFDRRTRSLIETGPARPVAPPQPVERTVEEVTFERVTTGKKVDLAPEDAAALAPVPPGGTARLMKNTMKVPKPGQSGPTTVVRKVVKQRIVKDMVPVFEPWTFSFSSDTDVTYDSNALTEPNAENDWIFNESVALKAIYEPHEESPWIFSGSAGYTLSRYDRFSSEDLDVFTVGLRAEYALIKDRLAVFLGNRVQWFYGRRFDESLFTRDRLDVGMDYIAGPVIITAKVDRYWYDHRGNDRTDLSISALYEWSNKRDGQDSGYLTVALGASLFYVNYDSDRERMEVAPEFELAYQVTRNVAITANLGYSKTDDSVAGRDYEQFVAAPTLAVAFKW